MAIKMSMHRYRIADTKHKHICFILKNQIITVFFTIQIISDQFSLINNLIKNNIMELIIIIIVIGMINKIKLK